MHKIFTSVLAGVITASVALIGASSAPAAPLVSQSAAPEIIGGTKSPATPWAVQLVYKQADGKTYSCTGIAIAASWVLTADHCVSDSVGMTAYYSNSTSNLGTGITADKLYNSPQGDVALVHLSKPKPLSSYPVVAQSYVTKAGDKGTIYGYGKRANGAASDGLYQANNTVTGVGIDLFSAPAIHVKGDNGAANAGDSGGPLFIGGKIVGILSLGDVANPGADIHAGAEYTNVTPIRQWIKNTSGV
ncbi:S1 family peptidase [Psychromicrobium sp. YIM B11713]|uniref:S1 family peptidase n=1 Tax=Psychromicrobium sp. YIM B11713 TaxID=3145233 RepID=UPI00374EBA9D